MHAENALSPTSLRDFADRVRRMAAWERDPHVRRLLLLRAGEYDRQARSKRRGPNLH